MARGWHLSFDQKLDRFLNNVEINNGCWEWKGYINPGGYGRYKWSDRKNWLAHRLIYKLVFGEFNQELKICHTCDNTGCVNPFHLFIGTQTENIQDMVKKGRQKGAKGENNINVKLNKKSVKDIRGYFINGGMNIRELAVGFNVSESTIRKILKFKSWKHINNQQRESV